jgi:hypothetical protein
MRASVAASWKQHDRMGRYDGIYGLPRNGCNNGGDHQN